MYETCVLIGCVALLILLMLPLVHVWLSGNSYAALVAWVLFGAEIAGALRQAFGWEGYITEIIGLIVGWWISGLPYKYHRRAIMVPYAVAGRSFQAQLAAQRAARVTAEAASD